MPWVPIEFSFGQAPRESPHSAARPCRPIYYIRRIPRRYEMRRLGGGVCLHSSFLSAAKKDILGSFGTYEANRHDVVRTASVIIFRSCIAPHSKQNPAEWLCSSFRTVPKQKQTGSRHTHALRTIEQLAPQPWRKPFYFVLCDLLGIKLKWQKRCGMVNSRRHRPIRPAPCSAYCLA